MGPFLETLKYSHRGVKSPNEKYMVGSCTALRRSESADMQLAGIYEIRAPATWGSKVIRAREPETGAGSLKGS